MSHKRRRFFSIRKSLKGTTAGSRERSEKRAEIVKAIFAGQSHPFANW